MKCVVAEMPAARRLTTSDKGYGCPLLTKPEDIYVRFQYRTVNKKLRLCFQKEKVVLSFISLRKKYVVGLELELVWKVSTENGGLERKKVKTRRNRCTVLSKKGSVCYDLMFKIRTVLVCVCVSFKAFSFMM